MPTPATPPFGHLLRELRRKQDVSQDDLSARSGLSVRQISSLETGEAKWPRKDTIRRLADALELEGLTREKFEVAARGRVAATGSGPVEAGGATRVLPRDTPSFIGREDELSRLAAAARTRRARGIVTVYAIDGMPGVGKTAFAIHAAHELTPLFPDPPVFLSLAGHVAGRIPVRPTDALAALLLATGMSAKQIPASQENRAELWRSWLADKRLMLLLDDAADSTQVEPLLPGGGNSMVVITSRRRLIALKDVGTVTLNVLPHDQAAELLARHADRPGLTPADTGMADISRLCGRLPLAVGIIGRLLHHHPASSPADLAEDLSQQRDRLELMAIENLSVAAAFDLSYQRLRVGQQQMFRRLALHPGSDIDAYAAAALDGSELGQARRHLAELYAQHLLTEPAHGRYRLHDLTREYASSLAQNEDAGPDRIRRSTACWTTTNRRPRRPTCSFPPLPDRPARRRILAAL
jgi:transcriptional regulator with XRE-family HTH domain